MPRATRNLLWLLCFPLFVQAQVLFKSDTNLVKILATVCDDRRHAVRGLTRDDFTLSVDGVPHELHDFVAQTDVPLTLALLVDTSRSMTMVLDYERQASIGF